jgi:hypothetical protein
LGGCGSIIREGGGRPYFADRRADFSISHSRNIAAVTLCKAPATRTGCDIQYIDERKNHAEISSRFFHKSEQNYIAAGRPEERAHRFYHVWVLKEAWLKLRGLSVFEMQHAPEFSIGRLPVKTDGPCLSGRYFLYEIETPEGERYALAVTLQIFHAENDFKFLTQRRKDAENTGALGHGGAYSFAQDLSEPEFHWFSEPALAVSKVAEIYAAQRPANTVTPNR